MSAKIEERPLSGGYLFLTSECVAKTGLVPVAGCLVGAQLDLRGTERKKTAQGLRAYPQTLSVLSVG